MPDLSPTHLSPDLSPDRLMSFVHGFAPPMLIETALRFGIFDLLDEGPQTLDQLCVTTDSSERGLRIMLNALVGLGLLSRDVGQRYALTGESAAYLVTSKPGFQGAFFLLTSDAMWSGWRHLYEVVRTGQPARAIDGESDGVGFFLQFVEGIFYIHQPAAETVADALGVSEADKPLSILDVAAGSGVWSIALARQSPETRVTAVDWPGVIPVTRKVTAREGVGERYKYVAGDLHEADFGDGHDIATLGHIVHSEGEAKTRRLLAKVHNALAPGGTVVIAELLVNTERTAPLPGLIFAVNMLVNSTDGDTFSYEEISGWLSDVDFENIRTIDAPGIAPRIILANRKR